MLEGRGAAQVVIASQLTQAQLRTAVADFTTIRAKNDTVIVNCNDQLNGVDLSIKEMLEATMKQCSMSPAFKTKVGSEATATVSVSSTKRGIFKMALNAKEFVGTGANINKTAYTIGDDSGARTGSTQRPFKTVFFIPYENGVPTPNPDTWITFPSADIEGDMTMAIKIGEDRSYTFLITGYDPNELNYRAIIGDPALVIPAPL